MNLLDLIRCEMQSIEQEFGDENALVFFLGVTNRETAYITQSDKSLYPSDAKYFDEDGYFRPSCFSTDARKALLTRALVSSGVLFGTFEEFVALFPFLKLLGSKVIVVNNNLMDGKFVSCISKSEQDILIDYYDGKEGPNDSDPAIEGSRDIYSNVVLEGDGEIAVSYLHYQDECDCAVRPLFASRKESDFSFVNTPQYKVLDFDGPLFSEYLRALLAGEAESASFRLTKRALAQKEAKLSVLLAALDKFGIVYDLVLADDFDLSAINDRPLLRDYLSEYWAEGNGEYRQLLFYKNPEKDKELEEISQGVIINRLVDQAELAKDGQAYRNMFVTAPTGAGKSLLFQLPALYLARNYSMLTIVVSPLISLMRDQVRHLQSQGIREAIFLNSDISHEDRDARIEAIRQGKYSIVYMSPEMLLNSIQIRDVIDERHLGLVVIDEAHTVATWGKDFRSDYWFLGDFFRKVRRGGKDFPIACFTATAVLSGAEDTVSQTLEILGVDNPIIYFGNTRRDNISFDIKVRNKQDFEGTIEDVKVELAADAIESFIKNGHKTLVYCPYVSHTTGILDATRDSWRRIPPGTCWVYHGRLDSEMKKTATREFKENKAGALICTKAFGMGVDILGIDRVYHFAPTGGLSDYVQEIGRAGRNKGMQAVAAIDYFSKDVRYARTLAFLSGLTLKQLREIMGKLYELYVQKNRKQNMLVSPESFGYLFGENDAEQQFKKAMLILQDDFRAKYGFPVIVVRPRASFTKNFINVPSSVEEPFLRLYGKYATRMSQPRPIVINLGKFSRGGCVTRSNTGVIYSLDMASLWEEKFPELSFADFKRRFFEGELFKVGEEKVSPRKRLKIVYKASFEETMAKYEECVTAIQDTLVSFKTRKKAFTKKEFAKGFLSRVGDWFESKDTAGNILDFFLSKTAYKGENTRVHDSIRIVFERGAGDSFEKQYVITAPTYVSSKTRLLKDGWQCHPDNGELCFETYIPADNGCERMELRAASLFQLFGLGTYEVVGGENLQVFVRLNDPQKIRAAAVDPSYKNQVLSELNWRKDRSAKVMNGFFKSDLSDDARWNVIEDYFLGNDSRVDAALGLAEE